MDSKVESMIVMPDREISWEVADVKCDGKLTMDQRRLYDGYYDGGFFEGAYMGCDI